MPLFEDASQALQIFYKNKIHLPLKELGAALHLYIHLFDKFNRDAKMIAESIRTIWLILERVNLGE